MSPTTIDTSAIVLALAAGLLYIGNKINHPYLPPGPWLPVAIVVLYWVLWRGWLFPTYFSELRHVPTVKGFPLWGQFIPIIFEECGVPQRRWHRIHGPIIRYYFPFGCERLSVADDQAIKHMTVKNPYNFPKPLRAKLWMVRILGEGVLLAEGTEHAHQRKALNPGFSISAIRTFTPIFWQKAFLMADLQLGEMQEAGESTTSFEILEWLNRCTLDIIGKAGFGYNIDSLEDLTLPIRQAYRLVFNFDLGSRILHGVQAFFPKSKHLPAKMNRDMEQARHIILDMATTIINEKLQDAEENSDAKDVLALIAQENLRLKQQGEPGLSFETMRDQVMTFLAAGHDTTATGVAWTIHLLSIHPEIQDRLRREIAAYIPDLFDNTWCYLPQEGIMDVDRLPYLDNVCRESLRFIPPIPMTVRESVEDDMLGQYKVPGRTVIYMLSNAINRMEWFWGDDADQFDPDRWDHLPSTAVPNAFMTFLQGPRGCLGRKFAEVEMKVLLCVLLSRWKFERDPTTPDPEDWKMWRLVLRPRDGVTVKAAPVTTPSRTYGHWKKMDDDYDGYMRAAEEGLARRECAEQEQTEREEREWDQSIKREQAERERAERAKRRLVEWIKTERVERAQREQSKRAERERAERAAKERAQAERTEIARRRLVEWIKTERAKRAERERVERAEREQVERAERAQAEWKEWSEWTESERADWRERIDRVCRERAERERTERDQAERNRAEGEQAERARRGPVEWIKMEPAEWTKKRRPPLRRGQKYQPSIPHPRL